MLVQLKNKFSEHRGLMGIVLGLITLAATIAVFMSEGSDYFWLCVVIALVAANSFVAVGVGRRK